MNRFLFSMGLMVCVAIGAAIVASPGEDVAGRLTHPSAGAAPADLHPESVAKAAPAGKSSPEQNRPLVAQQYARLPLAFEPNLGQASGPAKFLARGSGYSIFLTGKETVLVLPGRASLALKDSFVPAGLVRPADRTPVNALRMQFVGANPAATLDAQDELPGKSNYFIGTQEHWRTGVPTYRKVTEHNVYKGIDLVYYGNQRQLEYDAVLAPGADPHAVRWSVQGARKLTLNPAGDLILDTDGNPVVLHKPVAYQMTNGARHLVPVNYVLEGKSAVSLQVGVYDASQTLIIDPVLSYSTYIGGSNIDGANAIAVASDKTAFIAGQTFSTDFPTEHSILGYQGSGDAFVSKLSADGSTLLYSTYLGGDEDTVATAIAVDNIGNAYVAGWTRSDTYPGTSNAFDPNCGGDGKCGTTLNTAGLRVSNGFVTKLNPEGSTLNYSTYLGYYEDVRIQAIAVDTNEIAYVTGETGPAIETDLTPPSFIPFPTTTNIESTPVNSTVGSPGYNGGQEDAFVTAISATGDSLLYSSYLGGDGEDVGYGIATDGFGNVYVTGLTYSSSTTFPTTVGAFQSTYGGEGDAFAVKINTTATGAASLLYSTFFGGASLDQGNSIAVDQSGNMYVAGLTNSSTLTVTPSTARAYAGGGDAFVARFNPAASGAASLVYFTYLGGSLGDEAFGVAVDSSDDAYVTGSTVSTDFPTTSGVFQPVYGGGNADAFVTELDPTGATLVYSTYLGGTNTDVGYGIGVDTDGSAYVAGQTCSLDFPLSNPEQASPGSNCDAFVSKVSIQTGFALNPSGLVFPPQSLGTTSTAESVTLTNGQDAQTISSIALQGTDPQEFAETSTCGSSLIAAQTCTISVTFTPTAVGTRTATVVITDSAPGTPQVISLTGTTSTLTLSASEVSFGNEAVGVASGAMTVTATNVGSTAVTISSITASGDFSETDDCTKAALQPSTNCVINVTYTPSAVGASIGALTLTDNAAGSPQIVLLNGTGVAPVTTLALSPTSISFANQTVGAASSAQTVTATNTGTTAVTITSIIASGAFAETDDCVKATLQPNTNCTINVTFTPLAAGTAAGAITIADNVPGSPQLVSLSGTGIAATTSLTLSPTSLAFATQTVGVASTAQTVTATNTGTAAVTISSIIASGAFTETDDCIKAALQPNTSCTIGVVFTPAATGATTGAVTISYNSPGSPQVVSLTGTGAAATSALTLSPTTLGFGNQTVGVASTAQTVTATNTGTAAVTISSIIASGAFTETDDCIKAALQPGNNCTINVTFTPQATGAAAGTVTITDNVPGSPQLVSLTGTGVAPTSVLTLSPTSLAFSNQTVGVASSALTLTATSTGTAPVTISSITASGAFSESDNCTKSALEPGSSCTVSVVFTPVATGATSGAITIADNVPGSPQVVSLSGTGIATTTTLTLSPASLSFGNQTVDVASAAQALTATNTGTTPVTVSGITASGAFSETDNCSKVALQVNTSCTINVTFTPSATGATTGAVTITDNAAGSPQVVSVGGTGVAPSFTVSAVQSSASVPAGDAASYTMLLASVGGFSQPVLLTCTGLPAGASCGATPNPAVPSATPGTAVTLTIATALRASAPGNGQRFGGPHDWRLGPGLMILSVLLVLLAAWARAAELLPGPRALAIFGCAAVLALISVGCGSAGSTAGTPAGTPAGTYTVTVIGTSATSVQSVTTVTLQVK